MKKSLLCLIIFLSAILIYFNCNGDLLEEGPDATTSSELDIKYRGVWIVGGAADVGGATIIREIDLYDPVTDTWYLDVAANASGSSYSPRAFTAAVSIAGKIYMMGGASNSTTITADVFVYDIAENSWSTLSNISLGARMDPSAYIHGGYIFLIGGSNTITTAGVQITHLRLNTSGSGTWTTLPPANFTTARAGIGCNNFNGTITVTGGRIAGGTGAAGANSNYIYLLNQNAYTAMMNVPLARAGFAYAGYSGINGSYLFMVGGAASLTTANAYFTTVASYYNTYASCFQVYTPPATASGFFNGTPHPSFVDGDPNKGIAFAAASVSPYNGSSTADPTLYVFGGIKDRNTVTNEVFSITANGATVLATLDYATGVQWQTKTLMPRARFGHSAVTINQ